MSPSRPFRMPPVEVSRATPIADQIYDELYRAIVFTDLKPGTKLSEAEIAKQAGVSRQPARDAFFRLSQIGFLVVRPQRATVVSPISEASVMQAQFIRCALEMETARMAARNIDASGLARLEGIIEQQRTCLAAGDTLGFFALDEVFHSAICEEGGHAYSWPIIKVQKSHMDRMRFLSLAINSSAALDDHTVILEAIRNRDGDKTAEAMRLHLTRIFDVLKRIRAQHGDLFVASSAETAKTGIAK